MKYVLALKFGLTKNSWLLPFGGTNSEAASFGLAGSISAFDTSMWNVSESGLHLAATTMTSLTQDADRNHHLLTATVFWLIARLKGFEKRL